MFINAQDSCITPRIWVIGNSIKNMYLMFACWFLFFLIWKSFIKAINANENEKTKRTFDKKYTKGISYFIPSKNPFPIIEPIVTENNKELAKYAK